MSACMHSAISLASEYAVSHTSALQNLSQKSHVRGVHRSHWVFPLASRLDAKQPIISAIKKIAGYGSQRTFPRGAQDPPGFLHLRVYSNKYIDTNLTSSSGCF